MEVDLVLNGVLHLVQKHIHYLVAVVKFVLRQIVERDQRLVDGGQVADDLAVAVLRTNIRTNFKQNTRTEHTNTHTCT